MLQNEHSSRVQLTSYCSLEVIASHECKVDANEREYVDDVCYNGKLCLSFRKKTLNERSGRIVLYNFAFLKPYPCLINDLLCLIKSVNN